MARRFSDMDPKKVLRVLYFISLIAVISTAILLSGCSTVSRMVDYGAAANSEAVEASVFTICEGASIGSIRRQFITSEQVETWRRLCDAKTEFAP